MKNIFICLVFVASLIVSPLAVFSQDETVTETPEIVLMELSGVVVSVDLQEQQIGIEYQLDDLESATTAIFDLSETVEIYKNEQVITATEIKNGDKVTITYQLDENSAKVITKIVLES
ncbi:MAG: hypothetical protein A2Y03_01880 [Omnitrophica WOR_2 bacterium GWF2_38_59]|nr:MAG: hypothetical protein A2Y03_01880 [Omnitrophica WOR_2 bacterium GWF2_38_59]OGX50901.1 MAG: hypothetical protein A2243_06420 [Omnitrophica WOR_2 bacterium RIFOXYA2_FULL_38_17]OGX55296.1 MAG: hypothetical protein A2447_00695 [Omnitrophica WOR_2 bacterium RIFOXYC2_FULL_38_12]OGX60547.1 MAG: hypothetical protein A2306_03045 [Omnitrophica WOR_2 bacterium RIFOXYB2_FULL_38_16]HBG61718.1 hypothetical protein [Candidatus Omnitrophota bacterium]